MNCGDLFLFNTLIFTALMVCHNLIFKLEYGFKLNKIREYILEAFCINYFYTLYCPLIKAYCKIGRHFKNHESE